MPTEGQRSRAPGSRRAELQISQEYAVFDNVLETMEEYLTADTGGNATRLGIATEVVTDLTTYQTDWNTKYATYKDPATHTPAAVEAVRVAYKTGQEKVRSIQRQVKNAAVEKTADDYKSLSIHIDKETKTRVPRPTEAPSIVETHRAIGSNKFLVQVSSGEGQAHNRLPLANHIRYRVAHQTPGQNRRQTGTTRAYMRADGLNLPFPLRRTPRREQSATSRLVLSTDAARRDRNVRLMSM